MFFEKAIMWLIPRGYKFTELDKQYLEHNSDKYMPILRDLLSKDKV